MPAPSSRASNLDPRPYVGRFAPSPTGPLHFGSLVAALGSYLQAKSRGGLWQVRIDDIDPPRAVPGASSAILRTLECFGFEWDGPVSYQSQRQARYRAALDSLRADGLVYDCGCSRKEIAEQLAGSERKIYPGTCRNGLAAGKSPRLLRILTDGIVIRFEDGLQGQCEYDLERTVGDFVVLRADGLFAYQLATGVDDAEQGITEVVRGRDLLDSTPCQIHIQRCLGLNSPAYCHLPIVLNEHGQKLSKQNLAPPLDELRISGQLHLALEFLGQAPPPALADEPPATVWEWAVSHWQLERVQP